MERAKSGKTGVVGKGCIIREGEVHERGRSTIGTRLRTLAGARRSFTVTHGYNDTIRATGIGGGIMLLLVVIRVLGMVVCIRVEGLR